MGKMTEKEIIEKIGSGYSLPSLSAVAVKLVEIASSESCSVAEMAELIEKDPGLTARLISIANSVFFRAADPVSTIEQSIMRVGSNHLRVMALSLSLRDTFPMGKVGPMDFEKFWRSSLYQALIAKSLAQKLRTCNPQEAFTAGLLLEIGLLIFFDIFIKGKRVEKDMTLSHLESLLKWETENYGIDHRKIGSAALAYWKFPQLIIECQLFYNIEQKKTKIPPLALVCEMAREFAALICEETTEWVPLFHRAEAIYGIDQDMFTDIIVAAFEEVQQVADSLKVDMNRDNDLLAFVEKANTSLSGLSEKILELQETASKQSLPSFENMPQIDNDRDSKAALQAVARQIRNPLMTVSSFAKKLAGSIEPSSESWKYVQIVIDEAVRLESALSKIERGSQK